ncbi:MAG: helix-turn-helix transcriptional regulator [Clostridia bacterium]|nr:helix-turn-helix transcriptional regulator [Clostridia bacterium]
MNEKSVGTRIAELRNAKKLTQVQLAEKLTVSDKTVSKWEVGGGYPDISLLPALADIFECTVDYLLLGASRTQQKIFIGYPHSIYNNGKLTKKGITQKLNEEYLPKGWKVIQAKLSCAEDNESVLVVIEK